METVYDPFASLEYEKERERANHRRSRKANRKVDRKSVNDTIGRKACKYGKRMLHRYNRRNWNPSTVYHKVKSFNFTDILWDMT